MEGVQMLLVLNAIRPHTGIRTTEPHYPLRLSHWSYAYVFDLTDE